MGKYQTIIPRIIATLIDFVIFIPLIYLEHLILIPELPFAVSIISLILYYLVGSGYNIIFHAYFGQTIGKMIMKIRLVDVEDNPIGFKKAILRDSPYLFLGMMDFLLEVNQISLTSLAEIHRESYFFEAITITYIILGIAEVIVTLSNSKRRRLSDYIAGTVVIKTNV